MLRNYALPLLLALLLHAGVAAALLHTWEGGTDEVRMVQPRIIQAKVLVMEPPKAAPAPAQKPAAKPKPVPKPQPPAPKPRPKPAPKPDAAPKPAPRDAAAERRAREEAERAERLKEMLARSTALALQDEEAAAQSDGDAAAATMTYSDAIAQAIVREWSRPPSARNDMEARMVVELTPAGDLLGVEIADSSGNAAFDRAAEAAVRKAARRQRFAVPPERSLFEAHFRRFTLLFKPEDLLR